MIVNTGSDIPVSNLLASNNECHDQSNLVKPSSLKRPKRSFEHIPTILEPYRKKPKISSFEFEHKSCPRPKYISTIEHRDIFWMLNIALKRVPM